MSVTTGVKGINKLLAIADTLDIGTITDGEVLTRSGTNIISTALPGAVNSVTVTAPITLGGTPADPVIGHQLGAGGVFAYPYNLNTNATGHVTSCQTGTGNGWFSNATGVAPITVTTNGIVPNRNFTVSHGVSGSGAGTATYPSSITYNVQGHITAITSGSAPAAVTRVMATRDLFAGTLTIAQGNLSPLFGILGVDANGTTGTSFGIWSTSPLGNLFDFAEAGMYSITYHVQSNLNFSSGIGAESITSIRSEAGSRGTGVDLDTVTIRAPAPGGAVGVVKARFQSTLTTTFAIGDQISFSYFVVQTASTNDIIASPSNSSISIIKLT